MSVLFHDEKVSPIDRWAIDRVLRDVISGPFFLSVVCWGLTRSNMPAERAIYFVVSEVCDGCVEWGDWGLEWLNRDELASSRRSSGLKTLEEVFLGETPRFRPLRGNFRRFFRLKWFSRRSWDRDWRGPLRYYALQLRESGLGGVGVLGSPPNARLQQFLNEKLKRQD